MSDLKELFKGKPHLEVLLRGRRWVRVKARITKMSRLKVAIDIWDILVSQGINSLIVVGNLEIWEDTWIEANHVWLIVQGVDNDTNRGFWFSIEPKDGEVYDNILPNPYANGYYYTSPSELRADVRER